MATSGTTSFAPTNAEWVDEAWERCNKNPRELTAQHLDSARRSINLMLADWHTDGHKQWKLDLQTTATTVGMTSFTPPTGTIDVFDMVLRRDSNDVPMQRISRDDYMNIANKATQGRPDRYFVDRLSTPVVYIWLAGENITDSIRYYRLKRVDDAGRAHHTMDLPYHWSEAFAAGLAAKLAEKWAPEREDKLLLKAQAAFRRARAEDRDRADVSLQVRY